MTDNIIDLDEHRQIWTTAQASCAECGHIWQAVHIADNNTGLECSQCGKMAGYTMPKHKQNTQGLFEILEWASKNGFGGYGKAVKKAKEEERL